MTRSVSVSLVNCQHPPDDVRVVEKLARTLRDQGIHVTWIGPHSKSSHHTPSYGIDYHFFDAGKGRIGRLLNNHRAAFALARRLPRADVYVGVEPDSAQVASRLARLKGARSIFDVHEVYADDMLQRWSMRGTRTITRWVVGRGLRKVVDAVDLVIGVNKTVLEPYTNCATPKMIVRNCAPSSFAAGEPARVFERDGLVAMQGKATLAHGSRVVVDAFGLLAKKGRNVRAIFFDASDITGSGLDQRQLDAHIQQSGATGAIDIRKRIPMTSMPAVLRECDVGLITYNRLLGTASLPNKLFEFMAAGLPIIAPTYAREIRPIIEKERCGLLVDCEDAEALASAVDYLYEHRAEAAEMGRRARVAFVERHSFEAEMAPLIAKMSEWAGSAVARH